MPATGVDASQLADLVLLSQESFKKGVFTQDAQTYQDYFCLNLLFQPKKRKTQGGKSIFHPMQFTQSDTARHTALYGEKSTTVTDLASSITCPWRFTENDTAWDLDEVAMNAGREQIVDLINMRRSDMYLGLYELLEDAIFKTPTSGSDVLTPYGIPVWVVYNATDGFTGGDPTYPSGGAGGVATADEANWKNYSFTYTSVTDDDLVLHMRRAAKAIRWRSPTKVAGSNMARSPKQVFTTTENTLSMETLASQRNDNLGTDFAIYMDEAMWKRHPIRNVERLDDTTDLNVPSDPIYMLNTDFIYPVFLQGRGFKESAPIHLKETQPTVVRLDLRMAWNLICTSRRSQAIGATGA